MSVRIKHHAKGYAALLRDPKILADLTRRAERIATAAGEDVVAETSDPIRRRNRAAVVAPAGDPNNAIIRALDAGR